MSFEPVEEKEKTLEEMLSPEVNELLDMLAYRRPHLSESEKLFIEKYIIPLGASGIGVIGENIAAAYFVTIPKADGTTSKTMFSCHTDTVHSDYSYKSYQNPKHLSLQQEWDSDDWESNALTPVPTVVEQQPKMYQQIMYDIEKNQAFKQDGEPLGADDGAGCWLLMQMIRARVPGTYMFHRGEERGGIGSTEIAKSFQPLLKMYDRAIAFDRKATYSVITHQGSSRCCSDVFGSALADGLNKHIDDGMFVIDDGGVYTDTKEYIDYIPECTNVSCGYAHEHSGSETLDVGFIVKLAVACIALDWEALPTVRKAGETEYKSYRGKSYSGYQSEWQGNYLGYSEGSRDFGIGANYGFSNADKRKKPNKKGKEGSKKKDARGTLPEDFGDVTIWEFISMSEKDVEDFVWDEAEQATEMLLTLRDILIERMGFEVIDR